MKFEKAKEWRVPVVNVQWLSDLVLGQMDALRLPVQMRYLQVGHARDFYADLSKVWQWMSTHLYFSVVVFLFFLRIVSNFNIMKTADTFGACWGYFGVCIIH